MDIFLARQAIYDRKKDVVAYELLYRNSLANRFDTSINAEEATYTVIENILSIGLENIINNKIALINCNENILLSDVIFLLPKKKIIIEILETVVPTLEVIKRVKTLKEMGYSLALDDVTSVDSVLPFIRYISGIKIDYSLTDINTRQQLMELAKKHEIYVLAEKIENEDEFVESFNGGIEYFQGYYFSKPAILQGKDAIIRNSTVLQVLSEVSKSDFEVENIEKIIKSDVVLTYKLINYINSAHFGFKMQISSIKQAIMLIGIKSLKKWLTLIAFLDLNKNQSSEYTNSAIVRAKFCECIANRMFKSKASEAFIVGVFSEFHLIIKEDSKDVIDKLPVKDEIKAALFGEKNVLREILDLVISYENMEIDNIIKLSAKLRVDSKMLKEDYFNSIKWVEELTGEKNVEQR